MDINTIVLIVILVVMIYALSEHWKEKNKIAEENRQKTIAEKDEISNEDIATYGQVQERKNQLLGLINDNLSEHPQESNQLKEIIEDWAELKIDSIKSAVEVFPFVPVIPIKFNCLAGCQNQRLFLRAILTKPKKDISSCLLYCFHSL